MPAGAPAPNAGGIEPLLRAQDLRVVLGGRPVLDGLTLAVAAGTVHALLGPNGSGKSSVAYTLMGCSGYALEAGSIALAGQRIDGLALHERAWRGLALAWQEPARFEGLRVAEFLALGSQGREPDECLRLVGLKPEAYLLRALDKTLSGGERKRIELAGVLALKPRLVILDEPTAGIDLLSMSEVLGVIDTFKREGSSVLLITHQENVAERADRASQLCAGRIVREGTPPEVIAHYKSRACERCDGRSCRYE